jgi:hypothetical protein
MSKHVSTSELATLATVTSAPALTRVDRTFELPTGLYAATVGLYLAFLGVMAASFVNPELAIPMVIFVFFIVVAFGVAGKWASMQPANESQPLSLGQFRNRGIMTLSGKLTAGEASVQVLMLPALIFVWGLAVATIAAFVR